MMKKLTMAVGALLFVAGSIFAANQYNWGTSTGGAWNTPDDTATTAGQVLQVGPSGGAVVQTAAGPLVIKSYTLTQLNGLTPGTTNQMAICSDCLARVAISTGINPGAWVTGTSSITHIN